MVSPRRGRTGLMGQRPLLSVLSRQRIRFCTTSTWTTRSAHTGTIPISVRHLSCAFEHLLTCLTATQYCDGLRGVFIVDDPSDPHKFLYDVDDGLYIDAFTGHENSSVIQNPQLSHSRTGEFFVTSALRHSISLLGIIFLLRPR
jgi:hypothetical protein